MYEFWHGHIAEQLLRDGHGTNTIIVNCASQEYAKSVLPYLKTARVITCEFPGPSVYAKKARGMLCRYGVKNNCAHADDLKAFTGWGEDRYENRKQKQKNKKCIYDHMYHVLSLMVLF